MVSQLSREAGDVHEPLVAMYNSGSQNQNQKNGGKPKCDDFSCYYCGKVGHKKEF